MRRAILAGVLIGLVSLTLIFTGISVYWMIAPSLSFIAPDIKIIKQRHGIATGIDIVTDNYNIAPGYTMQIKIVNSSGKTVKRITAWPIIVGKKYMVLTGSDLDPGLYEIYAVIRYDLNPIREIIEKFPIAVLIVEEP